MNFDHRRGDDSDRRPQHGSRHEGAEVTQTNLVSDGFVDATTIDSNLVNPWGISFSPTGPFWISDNGTGVATIYNGSGTPVPVAGNTAITVAAPPGQDGPSTPTGQVFNASGKDFVVSNGTNSAPAVFLFATEDGTISGWSPTVNASSSIIAVDNSSGGDNSAVYKALAFGTTDQGSFLYAANFRAGTVDKFDGAFNQVGSFTDPNLPAGYAPFNVQNLGGHLFVTYALQDDAKHDDVAGRGHGFVDEFDLNGNLTQRIASGGVLNSPWGLDIAPAGFGRFAGDLLVGNFGDGTIDAFDLKTDMLVGQLRGADGKVLHIGELWALTNGNGGAAGDPNTVYFTAGLKDEAHGLFGSLSLANVDQDPQRIAAAPSQSPG